MLSRITVTHLKSAGGDFSELFAGVEHIIHVEQNLLEIVFVFVCVRVT